MRIFAGKKLGQEEKDFLISKITALLSEKGQILFGYIYGSFLGEGPFRDIDVAIYLDPNVFKDLDEMFDYSLSLGAELNIAISNLTIDLRPLNLAPIPFKFNVLTRGRLLFTKDQERLIDFEGRTRSLYFDFLHHLRFYYKSIVLEM